MTPGARVAAAIEVLGGIEATREPADRVFQAYARARRYIGAGDRAAVAALVYAVLRRRAQLDWWLARADFRGDPTPRARAIAALAILESWPVARIDDAFGGARYAAPPLAPWERTVAAALAGRSIDHPDQPPAVRANVPGWILPAFESRFGAATGRELAALGEEAPLDLRANRLKAAREEARAALARDGIETAPTPLSPAGLRAPARVALGATSAFRDGLVEVQDEGSQLVALLADARPGMRVVDFCAGAGGKTLALAATMANKGRIVACDTSARRLAASLARLRRAGAFNVETRVLATERDKWIKRHKASFDRVLVDAPCTGTGAWRRNPDARWTLTEPDLAELAAKQARILDSAARLVGPGGRLVYATCSLLEAEDERRAEAFLAAHPDFAAVPVARVWAETVGGAPPAGVAADALLTPARHGTDGFFVAIFERSPA